MACIARPVGTDWACDLFAMATVAVVPGVVFNLAGGALFGPLWGGLWNLIDATLGATLFLITRYIAAGWVVRRAAGSSTG
jgi:uncharacterized membrane protein YdjX (TVP38/TMEM64 family)